MFASSCAVSATLRIIISFTSMFEYLLVPTPFAPNVNPPILLAPKLDEKFVIITDFAQILSLPPGDRAEIYAQLRDLYDGYAGKTSGMGGNSKYSGLKVTLLACSTPAVDSRILVNQNLGTRELIYRTTCSKNKDLLMDKCLKNE